MIVLAEEKGDQEKLLALCEKTAFGCKIASVAGCYGFDKGFACFWLDTTSQAVYCLVDGVMLLSGTVLDGEEALAFLRAVGAGAGVLRRAQRGGPGACAPRPPATCCGGRSQPGRPCSRLAK